MNKIFSKNTTEYYELLASLETIKTKLITYNLDIDINNSFTEFQLELNTFESVLEYSKTETDNL